MLLWFHLDSWRNVAAIRLPFSMMFNSFSSSSSSVIASLPLRRHQRYVRYLRFHLVFAYRHGERVRRLRQACGSDWQLSFCAHSLRQNCWVLLFSSPISPAKQPNPYGGKVDSRRAKDKLSDDISPMACIIWTQLISRWPYVFLSFIDLCLIGLKLFRNQLRLSD